MANSVPSVQTPSAAPAVVEAPPAFQHSTPKPAARGQLKRVLVVDASPGVCQQVGLALSSLKMEVEFADTIDEAYRMAKSQHYQLMIIDVAVDDAAGYRFCRTLAQDPLTRQIPIVAFTARKSWYSRVKVKLAGCRAYLPKPTRLDEFCRVVQSCIHTAPVNYHLSSGHS